MHFDHRNENPAAELGAIGLALQRLQDQRDYLDGEATGLARLLSGEQVIDNRKSLNNSGCRPQRGRPSED